MLAPKLRHRVTFQTRTPTQDATTGEVTYTWSSTVSDEPAEVVPLSGREFIASGATQSGVDTRMTVRWRSGLDEKMRIVFDGKNYNIHAILPDTTNRRWLTIMAQSGVNSGE